MILDRYLIRQFIPVFLVALSMFMFLLVLLDIFVNLWHYLNNQVAISRILLVSFYYLPKSLSFALPISLLFAAAYTLGDLYARNELTSVFTAGIPYWRFCVPLIFVGLFSAVFSFYFEDRVVIPSFKEKNSLSNTLLGRTKKRNNTDIVIKTEEGRVIYSVDYFNTESRTLEGLSIVEKDEEGNFLTIIRGTQAEWVDDHWEIHGATEYKWVDGILRNSPMMPTDRYREEPDVFLRSAVDVEELPAKEAKLLIEDLMQAGLPYIEARADYFHRYSFPATSIVVMLLSVAMGGRFKKNILLMSLLSSLMATVAYYVMEMISMMTAKLGLIPPALGAWFPVLGFILIGCLLLKSTRT